MTARKRSISVRCLLIILSVLCVPSYSDAIGQSEITPTLEIESRSVLVPVMLLDTETRLPVVGLQAKSFRVFEDGKEQKIAYVEHRDFWHQLVRDNLGEHWEWAWIPGGKWSTSDIVAEPLDLPNPYYIISYVPPPSAKGSCHQIRVKVNRADTEAFYRKDYCNIAHSPSDPIRGTPIDNKLAQYLSSGKAGRIRLAANACYFYSGTDRARVHIGVRYPLNDVKSALGSNGRLPFNILIIVSREDGVVVARHSETEAWGAPDFPVLARWWGGDRAAAVVLPIRYDAQVDIPPGRYRIAIAVSHDSRFGTIEFPLTIDSRTQNELGISSLALCKRVRKAGGQQRLRDFTPLISEGYEFSPAADSRFEPGQDVMAYFEIYDARPNLSHFDVRFRMKVTDVRTGAVKLNEEMSAAHWRQPGNSTVPVALKLETNKLPAGEYRLEIQAFDSGGKNTALRVAKFTVL